MQVVHDANGATTVSDLTLIDVNTPQVRLCMIKSFTGALDCVWCDSPLHCTHF